MNIPYIHIALPEYNLPSLCCKLIEPEPEKININLSQVEYTEWITNYFQKSLKKSKKKRKVIITGGGRRGFHLEHLQRILLELNKYGEFEISYEINSENFSNSYLGGIVNLGVDRIILPVVTFDHDYLTKNNLAIFSKQLLNFFPSSVPLTLIIAYGIPNVSDSELKTELTSFISRQNLQITAIPYNFYQGCNQSGRKLFRRKFSEKYAHHYSGFKSIMEYFSLEKINIYEFCTNKALPLYLLQQRYAKINQLSATLPPVENLARKLSYYTQSNLLAGELSLNEFKKVFSVEFEAVFPNLIDKLKSSNLVNLANNILTIEDKGVIYAHNFIPEIQCSPQELKNLV